MGLGSVSYRPLPSSLDAPLRGLPPSASATAAAAGARGGVFVLVLAAAEWDALAFLMATATASVVPFRLRRSLQPGTTPRHPAASSSPMSACPVIRCQLAAGSTPRVASAWLGLAHGLGSGSGSGIGLGLGLWFGLSLGLRLGPGWG